MILNLTKSQVPTSKLSHRKDAQNFYLKEEGEAVNSGIGSNKLTAISLLVHL